MARLSLLVLALVFGASTSCALSNFAAHHGAHDKLPHGSLNLTERVTTSQRDWKLTKRFDGARCTNYQAGLGACGATNTDNDMIVALNGEQYGNGEHCFDTITITYNGKSHQAQITDKCPDCPYGALDLTSSLFSYFASLDDGVFYASWEFGSGEASSSSSTPPPATSTSTHEKSSSTWTPETTSSSTWSSSSSTSLSSSGFTSTSSSSTSSASSSSSTSTTFPSTSSVGTDSALELLNYGIVQLGGLVGTAAQVNIQTSGSS